MKKFICLMAGIMMLLGLVACSNTQEVTDIKNPTESTVVDTTPEETTPEKKVPTIKEEDLKENEFVDKNDNVFSKELYINGEIVPFGTDFEKYFDSIGAKYLYSPTYQEFTQEKTKPRCPIDCYIEKDGVRYNFEAIIGYNDADEIVLVSLTFDDKDTPIRDMYLDIQYMGMDIKTLTMDNVPEELKDGIKHYEDQDKYDIFINSYYDDYSGDIDFSKDVDGTYRVSRFVFGDYGIGRKK